MMDDWDGTLRVQLLIQGGLSITEYGEPDSIQLLSLVGSADMIV